MEVELAIGQLQKQIEELKEQLLEANKLQPVQMYRPRAFLEKHGVKKPTPTETPTEIPTSKLVGQLLFIGSKPTKNEKLIQLLFQGADGRYRVFVRKGNKVAKKLVVGQPRKMFRCFSTITGNYYNGMSFGLMRKVFKI